MEHNFRINQLVQIRNMTQAGIITSLTSPIPEYLTVNISGETSYVYYKELTALELEEESTDPTPDEPTPTTYADLLVNRNLPKKTFVMSNPSLKFMNRIPDTERITNENDPGFNNRRFWKMTNEPEPEVDPLGYELNQPEPEQYKFRTGQQVYLLGRIGLHLIDEKQIHPKQGVQYRFHIGTTKIWYNESLLTAEPEADQEFIFDWVMYEIGIEGTIKIRGKDKNDATIKAVRAFNKIQKVVILNEK